MANTLRFKRGLASGIPTGVAGEPLFTTDTFDLYIGNGTTNTRFQKYIASGTTSQLLRGDGSLLTMPIVLTSPANGEVLKYNGTNWVNSSDAGITGSGLAGQVAYFTGATTQAGSNNLFWDSANSRLGIGTNTISGAAGQRVIEIFETSYPTFRANANNVVRSVFLSNAQTNIGYIGTTTNHPFGFLSNDAERARFHASGNFSIGSTTDSGQRLQVTGDTLLKGSGNTSATYGLTVQNSDGVNLFRVNNSGFYFLSGTNGMFFSMFTTSGGTASISGTNTQFYNYTTTQAATSGAFLFTGDSFSHTSGFNHTVFITKSFLPTSGNGSFSNLTIQPGNINQTGGANGITRGLYINPTLTAAADWRSIEWSNNSGWGLYGAGTANNYLAGRLGIGNTDLSAQNLYVRLNTTGAATAYNVYSRSIIQSDVTTKAVMFNSWAGTAAATFTLPILTHFEAFQLSIGAGSTLTNQFGFFANSTLIGATNNYGFYGDIASGTNRWNLYMNGTAANYLNGNTLIGSTTDSGEKLQVTGTARINGGTDIYASAAHLELRQTSNTSTDLTELYFYNAASVQSSIFFTQNNRTPVNNIRAGHLNINSSGTGGVSICSTSTGAFVDIITDGFSSAASSKLALRAYDGNVGIGVTPTEKLHVSGNTIITGNLTVDSSTFFVDATANEVGIGTNAPNSVLQVVGSVSKSISDVKTANYTATATDHTILCSAASGGITITLPAASGITGRIYVIKKTNASSGVNSVTVDGNGSETIDGSASINLACKSSVMLQCDGSNWHILSLYSDSSCL
jgi:hypothetical protein